MKKKKNIYRIILRYFILTVLILAVFITYGQVKAGRAITRATLKNGLRVVLIRNSLAPVATTVVNYLVGSDEAPDGFPGTAHAQEHMMFRGSPGLSAEQLAKMTAAMGGMFNADTQQTITQYFFTVPSEDLKTALHIEAIRMRDVLDSEKLWAEERGAIEQEVAQDLSNPEYLFHTELLSAMFKNSPYSTDALGSKQSFDKTTGAMLKNFYNTWYVPNNAILVVVGNFQPEKVLSDIKELFGDIPKKILPHRVKINLEPVQPQKLEFKTDLPYGLAVISFRMPGYNSPDYAPVKILAEILRSQQVDLYDLTAKGRALFTGFNIETLPEAGIGYVIAGFPKGYDSSLLIDDMKKILYEMLKKGITTDLVEAAKRHEITDIESQKDSIFGLAMSWSQALAVKGLTSPHDNKTLKAVTLNDVNRVLRKYINPDEAIISVLKPEASGKPVSTRRFGGGNETFNLTHKTNIELPVWADKVMKHSTNPSSLLHPSIKILPNGIKLIIQPSNISNIVSVYGHILNNPDIQIPIGKEGVDDVLDRLFSFGTKSFDRIAFQKELDRIGANESAGTDFSIQTLTEFFNRGVQLLAENELQPAFPEENFKIIQRQIAGSTAGQLLSPEYLSERALKKALFPKNDPSLRTATPETISSLTLQDVKDYYNAVFRPDMTVIVVTGNIKPEKVIKIINKYFGGWKNEGTKPDVDLPSVPFNQIASISIPNSSRVQDRVVLAETLKMNRADPDYYALELGNSVLGGGFYATRFYQDLREKTGLVYNVSSSFEVGRSRAIYHVDYACDPLNVEKAKAIIIRNLMDMQTEPVSMQTLNQAKSMMISKMMLSQSSLGSIARGYINRIRLDLPLDEPFIAVNRYIALTPEQVRDAYTKFIRPEGFVQIIEGPNP